MDEIKIEDSERQPCEVWTRVMGYFRPVSEFNIGKKSEYAERICFSEQIMAAHMREARGGWMNGIVVFAGQVALMLLSCFFAYKYGRKSKENEDNEKAAKQAAQADFMRRSLNDPDIVDKLHEEFRR